MTNHPKSELTDFLLNLTEVLNKLDPIGDMRALLVKLQCAELVQDFLESQSETYQRNFLRAAMAKHPEYFD